jgi:serine protease Do
MKLILTLLTLFLIATSCTTHIHTDYISPTTCMETIKSTVGVTNGVTLGSGVVINMKGDILTCAHVVHVKLPKMYITFFDSDKMYEYSVKMIDRTLDLAILTPKEPVIRFIKPVRIANNAQLSEKVYAVGHPFGVRYSMSFGHITNVDGKGWQMDNAINRGNSGGGLFNRNGELVGIVTHIYSKTGFFIGMSYATDVTRESVVTKFKLQDLQVE